MKKTKIDSKVIFASVLVLAGVGTAILGRTPIVQGGVTCLLLGLAVFVVALISFGKNKISLAEFDTEAQDILQDIATKGPESEYYQFYNIQIMNKLRHKFVKKQRKQTFGIIALGVLLIISAIICMV